MHKDNIESIYSLSPIQQAELHRIRQSSENDGCARLESVLDGPIEVAALERACRQALDRHSVLRSSFAYQRMQKPAQIVHKQVRVILRQWDLRSLSVEEQNRCLEDFRRQDRQKGFDPGNPPLVRAVLINLADDRNVFVWSYHHLVLDDSSAISILDEILSAYAEIKRGRKPGLPVARSYKDYIIWLKRQDGSKGAEFRRRAINYCNATPLAIDRKTGKSTVDWGREHNLSVRLSSPTTAALHDLSRRGVFAETVMIGAWATLLGRYGGGQDIVFGVDIDSRPAEIENAGAMIGPFDNLLPARIRLCDGMTVSDWLARIQQQYLDMVDRAYSSAAQPEQPEAADVSSKGFDTSVVLSRSSVRRLSRKQYETVKVTELKRFRQQRSPFRIGLSIEDEAELEIGYDSERFELSDIHQIRRHLEVLLQGFALGGEEFPSHLTIFSEQEWRQILYEWNGTVFEYLDNDCIQELFERQVEKTPDSVAVIFNAQWLTYRELNRRSNRLAHYLRSFGVGPEVLTGVCFERSPMMLIALIATLKSGGAYVPLDPRYPAERLSYMLDDSGISLILAGEHLEDELPTQWIPVICPEREWEHIALQREENPVGIGAPDNLAYVIYTSGSTGKPKGVMVSHRGLRNLAEAQVKTFGIEAGSRVLQFSSLSFDASIFEITQALRVGATLLIAKQESILPGPPLMEILKEQAINVLTIPPSALGSMPPEELPELDTIIVAGEACSGDLARRWGKGRRFYNAYGPTEATVWATGAECLADEERPTIGRPIINTQTYILDQAMRPTPAGVSGELCIAGVGLARCYLNNAEQTAEGFIPDPFGPRLGARMYHTGDAAKYRPNGEIEYVGRIDRQVKVRGHRVELGEIEVALLEHPKIVEAVVVARGEIGDKRLIAYVVLELGQETNIELLKQHLRERLPEYMIPATIAQLESLPLTNNGKVDRHRLPEPSSIRPELEEAYIMPQTPIEIALAEIWSEVLGIDKVGVNDNFFTLGGDSILSIQVLARAQRRGLEITLHQLFQYKTIRSLAQEVRLADEKASKMSVIKPFDLLREEDRLRIEERDLEDAYPLTITQEGMLFYNELNPEAGIYIAVNSYHVRVRFDQEALRSALAQMVARHPIMRVSFDLTNYSQSLQLVHKSIQLPFEVEDLRHLNEVEQKKRVSRWLKEEKRLYFDLSRPPLLRFYVHRFTEETLQFTFTAHHAIFDGWSDSLLLTELIARYMRILKGDDYEDLPFTTSFRDYVALEQESLLSEESGSFWERYLGDANIQRLPRWQASPGRGATPEYHWKIVPISPETSEGLKSLAQASGANLRSALLAAHARVIGLLTGEPRALTGLVWNGRPERLDGDRVLGLFLNTVPFRLNLPGGTWMELVQQAFQAEEQMVAHRRYPLGELQRKHGGSPLFETVLNFTHFHVLEMVRNIPDFEVLSKTSAGDPHFTMVADFHVQIPSTQLQLVVTCNKTEICNEHLESICEYYALTLREMAANPHAPYHDVIPLTPKAYLSELRKWNDTFRDYPATTIHKLFEEQAARIPDRVAVSFKTAGLSYQELNRRANRFANYLRRQGVTPGSVVALVMERSLELVVALLGVLKSGVAYLPLDPEYPQARLGFLLEESRTAVIVTQNHLVERLPESEATIICLESEWDELLRHCDENPEVTIDPDDLAYVIYTSGSTGQPKGVMATHRGLTNYVNWAIRAYDVETGVGAPTHSSIGFDLTITSLYLPLVAGRRVILAEEGQGIAGLSGAFEADYGLSPVKVTPSHLEMLNQLIDEPKMMERVRTLVIGGEALSGESLRKWRQNSPKTRLFNEYGPTETVVGCCVYEVGSEFELSGSMAIGRPIANTETYILDETRQPVGIGIIGELHIGGECLTRGYLNRPDLTAERFLPNPFGDRRGERMYMTGDLGRYRMDGILEYCGRRDGQIKIRGYRIELGEIEAELKRIKGVREAAVMIKGEGESKGLVAYVVMDASDGEVVNVIKSELKTRLPERFLPKAIVRLDGLPLTPHGKVDRQRLPEPERDDFQSERILVAPRNYQELELTRIWEELLGISPIGVKDDFFEVGGNSMLCMRLIYLIESRLGKRLPLVTLIQKPTIEHMATVLESYGVSANHSPLIKIGWKGKGRPFFCVHPGGGGIFPYITLSKYLGAVRPFYGIQATGFYHGQATVNDVRTMATNYIDEIRSVQLEGPYLIGGWSMGGGVAFEMARQLEKRGQNVALLALIDPYFVSGELKAPDNLTLLLHFATDLGLDIGRLRTSREELWEMSQEEQIARMYWESRQLHLLPSNIELIDISRLFEVFKSNVLALCNYSPGRYSGPVVHFKASECLNGASENASADWNKYACNLRAETLPGNHYTIMQDPNIQVLAKKLNVFLRQAAIEEDSSENHVV